MQRPKQINTPNINYLRLTIIHQGSRVIVFDQREVKQRRVLKTIKKLLKK